MTPIEFEPTPNPDALCIRTARMASAGPARQFTRASVGTGPVAAALLAIDGISRILIGDGFVTVVRADSRWTWDRLRPEIAFALSDTLDCEIEGAPPGPCPPVPTGEIEEQIEEVLDRWVRPLLAADGGDAVFVRYDPRDGTAWIRMEGACGGCPSGSITLKRGIEQTVRRWVPEVARVLAADGEATTGTDPRTRFRQWIAGKWGSS